MRTSLVEIGQIDGWINGGLDQENKLLFEAKLIVDQELEEKVGLQRETYSLVRLHGRKRLVEELMIIEDKLFKSREHLSFQQKIRSIFKS